MKRPWSMFAAASKSRRGRISPLRASILVGVLIGTLATAHGAPVGADTNEGTTNKGSQSVLTAGLGHTCVVIGGAAKCFGANNFGQVGNNSTVDAVSAKDVSGLSSGVTAVSAGDWHNCALTTGGGVKCWGRNTSGQLGNGTVTNNQKTPVNVDGLASGVTAVTGGSLHTCALTTGGGVKCWGYGTFGQLGDSTTTAAQKTPVDVDGLGSGVVAITAGLYHTCALTTGGGVKCWGAPDGGRVLGNGATTNQVTPADVSGLSSGVVAISAGELHTCALINDGTVKCWGRGNLGQLGNANWDHQSFPVAVAGLPAPVVSIAAGGYHTCAVTNAGAALCWGLGTSGQIGQALWTSDNIPVSVSSLSSGVTAVSAGQKHTCAIANDQVVCWGYNAYGQLGTGDKTSSNVPRSPAATVPTTTVPPSQGTLVAGGPVVVITSPTTVKSTTTTKPPTASKSPVTTTTRPPAIGVPIITTVPAARPGTTTVTGRPGTPPDTTPESSAENPEDDSPPEPPPAELIESLPEPYPPVGPVPPGIGVDIQVPSLSPGEKVDCWWLDSDGNVLADTGPVDCGTAGDDGTARVTVPVPPGAGSGLTLVAVGRTSGKGIRQAVLVDSSGQATGTTGGSGTWWWILVVAAVAGLFLFLIARRRRDKDEDKDEEQTAF